MRITALFGLAAIMLAAIVAVAPKATLMTDEMSAEVYGVDFFTGAQPMRTAVAR